MRPSPKKYQIALTPAHLDVVFAALGELPLKLSLDVFNFIQMQVRAQDQAAQTVETEVAGEVDPKAKPEPAVDARKAPVKKNAPEVKAQKAGATK